MTNTPGSIRMACRPVLLFIDPQHKRCFSIWKDSQLVTHHIIGFGEFLLDSKH